MKCQRLRTVGRWSVWVFTAFLIFGTVLSFILQLRAVIDRGTEESGITYAIRLSNGVMIYERLAYQADVEYSQPLTPAVLQDLNTKRWSGLHWELDWNSVRKIGRASKRLTVWKCFVPTRPHVSAFSVPLVSLLLLFLVLSRILYLYDRGRRRALQKSCVGCGYSLAGLDGGVCPECGAGADVAS